MALITPASFGVDQQYYTANLVNNTIDLQPLLSSTAPPNVTSGPQQQQQPHFSPPDTYDVSEPLLHFGTAFAGPGTPEGPMDWLETFLAGIPSNDGSEEWEAEELPGPTQAYSASMPGNEAFVGFDPAAYDIP